MGQDSDGSVDDGAIQREIKKIRDFSTMVGKRLDRVRGDETISRMAPEELEDLGVVLQTADFLLRKYERKKEVRAILEDFVGIINDTVESLGTINYQIDDLMLSADTAMRQLRELQSSIDERSLYYGSGTGKTETGSREEPVHDALRQL